jgi:hypothetical protein
VDGTAFPVRHDVGMDYTSPTSPGFSEFVSQLARTPWRFPAALVVGLPAGALLAAAAILVMAPACAIVGAIVMSLVGLFAGNPDLAIAGLFLGYVLGGLLAYLVSSVLIARRIGLSLRVPWPLPWCSIVFSMPLGYLFATADFMA